MQDKATTNLTAPGWWMDSSLLSLPPLELYPDGKNGVILVAALSEPGQQLAFARGRTTLIKELSQHCAIPVSKWYFVPEPVLIQADFRTIENLVGASRPGRPEEWGCIKRDGSLEYLLYISPDLRWFEDHFPGNPILPGVVQIHWAIQMGSELGFDPGRFVALPRVKFTAMIVPDSVVKLSLSETGTQLRFRYQSNTGSHSMGTVTFGEQIL